MRKFFYLLTVICASLLILACTSQDQVRVQECLVNYDNAIDQGMCIQGIALEKTTEGAALGICDEINSGVKHTCYRNIAVKFENKPLCFENENEIETYICLANLAERLKDATICPEIARKKDEEFCYRQVAVATLDETHCEKIIDESPYKKVCIGSVEFAKENQPLE